jgi:putative transposase
MRKTPLVTGEHYHVFNRGTEKRTVYQNEIDIERFFLSMQEFNSDKPIGSIYENSFRKANPQLGGRTTKLVNIICYCLNPNHFHLLLEQRADGGISNFIKKLSGGYTRYFNQKYKRSGVLFQGKFKSVHIDSNEYLLHVSAYINLNNQLKGTTLPLSKSSWSEYVGKTTDKICKTDIVLEQFNNPKEYEKFAIDSLHDIVERKKQEKELLEFF